MMEPRSEHEIQDAFLGALHSIAPEVDLQSLDPDLPLREQVDLDSMDFFNLMVGLHQKLRVEIPEADYPKLNTLRNGVAYLREKLKL